MRWHIHKLPCEMTATQRVGVCAVAVSIKLKSTLASSDKSVPNNGSRWRVLTQSQSVALKVRQTCCQKGEQTYHWCIYFVDPFSYTHIHVVDFIFFLFLFFVGPVVAFVVRLKIPFHFACLPLFFSLLSLVNNARIGYVVTLFLFFLVQRISSKIV